MDVDGTYSHCLYSTELSVLLTLPSLEFQRFHRRRSVCAFKQLSPTTRFAEEAQDVVSVEYDHKDKLQSAQRQRASAHRRAVLRFHRRRVRLVTHQHRLSYRWQTRTV